MTASEETNDSQSWLWLAVAAGAVLGAVGIAYLFWERNPTYRLDRLLRRCEDRIHNIEDSLTELESSLVPPRD